MHRASISCNFNIIFSRFIPDGWKEKKSNVIRFPLLPRINMYQRFFFCFDDSSTIFQWFNFNINSRWFEFEHVWHTWTYGTSWRLSEHKKWQSIRFSLHKWKAEKKYYDFIIFVMRGETWAKTEKVANQCKIYSLPRIISFR